MGRDSDYSQLLDSLERDMELVLRPPAKAMRSRSDALKEQAACRFRKMVDAACKDKVWNPYKLARRMGITNQYFDDLYRGKRNILGWHFEALPREAWAEELRLVVKNLRAAADV